MMQRRAPASTPARNCVDGREGQAPGAGIELAAKQLRGHGRLAVRRQATPWSAAKPCISQVAGHASRRITASGSGRSPRSTFQPARRWPTAQRRAVVRESPSCRRQDGSRCLAQVMCGVNSKSSRMQALKRPPPMSRGSGRVCAQGSIA
jgi:hypothetical protein